MKNKTTRYLHNFSYHSKAESDDCFFIHSKHFKPQTYIDLSFPRQFPCFSLLKKVNSVTNSSVLPIATVIHRVALFYVF